MKYKLSFYKQNHNAYRKYTDFTCCSLQGAYTNYFI